MSLLTENVIPSDHGRIFSTNASSDEQMAKIKSAIENVDGVKGVVLITEVFPKEFIVHTSKLVRVIDVEDAANHVGLHCISKGVFPLMEK